MTIWSCRRQSWGVVGGVAWTTGKRGDNIVERGFQDAPVPFVSVGFPPTSPLTKAREDCCDAPPGNAQEPVRAPVPSCPDGCCSHVSSRAECGLPCAPSNLGVASPSFSSHCLRFFLESLPLLYQSLPPCCLRLATLVGLAAAWVHCEEPWAGRRQLEH